MPTPAAGAKVFRFGADLARTGWYVTGDANPHWTDRNLHAGTYKGQNFASVLYFELTGLAPGSRILYAEVDLTGLSRTNIGINGSWSLKMLPSDFLTSWQERSAIEFQSAQAIGTVGPVLTAPDLAEGQVNQFIFSHDQLSWLEAAVNAAGRVGFRLEGPGGVQQDLFTWDAGDMDASESIRPALRIVAVPGQFVFVTNTPTPENVLTAAAIVSKSTAAVQRNGTPTLFPRNYATVPPDVAITPLPTPANSETVAAQSAYATAVAFTTGTFTPTPLNWVTVTNTPTNTPTPPIVPLGRLTRTPTATSTREISIVEYGETPIPVESGLRGNIVFYSDRDAGVAQVWVMDPKGNVFAKLMGDSYYRIALAHDLFSQDNLYHLDVGTDERGLWMIPVFDVTKGIFTPLIKEDPRARGMGSYHPAWSPLGDKIAYVSERTGNSEIYVYDIKTKVSTRITTTLPDKRDFPPFNKHPSWSPDGKQIIFFSDRGPEPYRKQIWIMNADGGGMHSLSPSLSNDWDPVWVKK
jgi:hypothetical protein